MTIDVNPLILQVFSSLVVKFVAKMLFEEIFHAFVVLVFIRF